MVGAPSLGFAVFPGTGVVVAVAEGAVSEPMPFAFFEFAFIAFAVGS